MSKIKAKKRHAVILQKRKRRGKLATLRAKYEAAHGSEKTRIKDKIGRIAPHLSVDEWLSRKS